VSVAIAFVILGIGGNGKVGCNWSVLWDWESNSGYFCNVSKRKEIKDAKK